MVDLKDSNVYYFSFGSGQLTNFDLPVRPDKLLIKVFAEDEMKARAQIFNSSIGENFCTSYNENGGLDLMEEYQMLVLSLDYVLALEMKYVHNAVIEIKDEEELEDIFRIAIDSRVRLLSSLHDNFLGTYYIWADGSYCLDTEIEEYGWKSDDFYIVRIKES